MEEILHQSVGSLSHYLQGAGFLPSTVSHVCMQKSNNCQVPQIQQNSRFFKLSLLLTIQVQNKGWLIWETFPEIRTVSSIYHYIHLNAVYEEN